jgi:hypothetical protein
MLDTYDFDGDVWLCHSFGGKCHDFTAFVCKSRLLSLYLSFVFYFYFVYSFLIGHGVGLCNRFYGAVDYKLLD